MVFVQIPRVGNMVESGYIDVANQLEYDALLQAWKDALCENLKEPKALFFIYQSLEGPIFDKIQGAKNGKRILGSIREDIERISKGEEGSLKANLKA